MNYLLAQVAMLPENGAIILKSETKTIRVTEINALTGKLHPGDWVVYTCLRKKYILLDRLVHITKHQPAVSCYEQFPIKSNLEFKQIAIQSRSCRWIAKKININNK